MGLGLGPHGRTAHVRVRAGKAPWRWGLRAEPRGEKDAEHLSGGRTGNSMCKGPGATPETGSGKPLENRETRAEMTDSRKQKDEDWQGAKANGLHLEMKGLGQSGLSVSRNLGLAGREGGLQGKTHPQGVLA